MTDDLAYNPKRLSKEALKQLEDLVEIWEDDTAGGDEDSGQVAAALSLLLEWYKDEHHV